MLKVIGGTILVLIIIAIALKRSITEALALLAFINIFGLIVLEVHMDRIKKRLEIIEDRDGKYPDQV